ncbi:MAG: M3 family oligoendopeptidase, partial [Defluviitaleaceae bacterium]|nr:M3 family oligoendopeptidase [Defluviitaleaceae bacterium]
MKFSKMPYKRPEFEEISAKFEELLQQFKNVTTAEECFSVYKAYDEYNQYVESMISIGWIRYTLDTTNEFYDKEKAYMDEMIPKLEEVTQKFVTAMVKSPFRKDMEEKWGNLMFVNAEMELKTFKPEIVPDLQEENRLSSEYTKLIASAQIAFDGKMLTLAQIFPYFENPDRGVREAALRASSEWRMKYADKWDNIFDNLVKLRTKIAKTLGYENYIQLAYYRRRRNCYDKDMVAKFREGVVKHIVPLVQRLKAEQAKRIGVNTLNPFDDSFEYPEGNAKPIGTPEDIFAHGKIMYHELSSDTAEFIDFMLENELFDVLTRPGKEAGGYCDSIPLYKSPFIFANFNGTSGDIDVLTHEAGHAYASYRAQDIYPSALRRYSNETAEVHSMAMEFFTWPWMEGFFGDQTQKYYYSHLAGALVFIPYGTMVDEFQHLIYEKPEMSPKERNDLWLTLEAKYRPYLNVKDFPFY